jgi:hypothetical protein
MTARPPAPAQPDRHLPAPSFADEISRARSYERGLLPKVALALALVAAAVLAHIYLFS